MSKRSPRTYISRSAGLAVNRMPAVGLALAKTVSFGDWSRLTNDQLLTVTEISGTMWRESPVLTRELLCSINQHRP